MNGDDTLAGDAPQRSSHSGHVLASDARADVP
jgi:hypothetical protein